MPLGDRTDMVYMNTSVTRGTGEFVVTATGMATEVGHISGMLQAQPAVKTRSPASSTGSQSSSCWSRVSR
jgi:magnesium-transporting ATPase (P-type)